jgi:hypothetical protein
MAYRCHYMETKSITSRLIGSHHRILLIRSSEITARFCRRFHGTRETAITLSNEANGKRWETIDDRAEISGPH